MTQFDSTAFAPEPSRSAFDGRSLVRALLFATACAGWVAAQDQPTPPIRAIAFTGLDRAGEVFARELIDLRVGEPAEAKRLDDAIARLMRSGRFLSVRCVLGDIDGGTRVTFEFQKKAVVTSIRFRGNSHFSERELRKLVTQPVGQAVDWLTVRSGRDAILAKYLEAGYGDATVDFDQAAVAQSGELRFTISEGTQGRIRRIEYEGNDTFDDRALGKLIQTKTAWWVFRTGAFDQAIAEADAVRLRAFHRDEGFLDARVSFRREASPDGTDLAVIFTIVEGTRYSIQSITFAGASVFEDSELATLIGSRVGETVKRPQVDDDVRTIHTRYGELGYIHAAVRVSRVFANEPGFVRIAFTIQEGVQFRVGRVVVRGNARTRDKVVRRALNLYPPDDLFDLTEAREAERRLRETKVFDSARVYPVGDEPGVRDVVIDVKEAEKAGDFIFGAGVTSNAGVTGNIVLDLQNFDISNPPRTLSELFKLRSFFGGGQRLRLELQPGTTLSRFRLNFTEPYFRDKPLRFDAGLYLFTRGREGYDERRVGANFSFGKRFKRGFLRSWSGEVAFEIENVSLRDIDIFAARTVRRDKGSNVLTSAKGSLVRDRTDNRFIPSAGDRLSLAYEQFGILGGDHTFGRLTADYRRYFLVRSDPRQRKHVLMLRTQGGAIIGDPPVFERFFAGGTGSIRGFEFRGVGEREGLDENNIGGDFMVLGSAEYSYPLIGDNVRGVFFLDTGLVGSGALRAAIGAGVRFTINIFGPVPLELNLALPVSSDEHDDEQVFSFLIGRIF